MLAVAILASFVAFLDGSVVNLALPAIGRDLGGGLVLQQWIIDSYLLTLGALILLAGSISDVFGRVPVLRLGLVAFGAGSVLAALSPSGAMLIVGRLVQGVGAAFLVPSSLALINATFDREAQPKAIGTWTAWTGTAFVLGPLLGGVAVDLLNWRWIFVLSAIPSVITFVLSIGLAGELGGSAGGLGELGGSGGGLGGGSGGLAADFGRRADRKRIDVPGAALAAVGLAGTVYALIELQRLGIRHLTVGFALTVGLISLAVFVWWEFRSPHPMVPMHLFAIRNFGIGNLATLFTYAGVSMGMLIVPLFTQEVAGFSATEAGLATLPLPVLSFLFARRVGTLSARFGPHVFMAAGPLIASVGFLLMRPQQGAFNFWTQLLPGLVVLGLGMTIAATPLTSAILAAVDASQSGIGSAINNAVSRIAGLIAVAFAGVIAQGTMTYDSFRRLALVTAALFLGGGLVSAGGIRNPEERPEPAAPEALARCRDRIAAPPGG
ncbi:MAG: MFS transporter [Mycobacteriaceae bacterium]|nr:MFS transporter [Mycobacteriaceae bacterium]